MEYRHLGSSGLQVSALSFGEFLTRDTSAVGSSRSGGEALPAQHRSSEFLLDLRKPGVDAADILRAALVERGVGEPFAQLLLLRFELVDSIGQGVEFALLLE